MDTPVQGLEIQVYLENGLISRFSQAEPVEAARLLENIQPTRLFATPHLMFGNATSLTMFQSARVVRVDLIADKIPFWAFTHGATEIQEITEDDFLQRYRPENYSPMAMEGLSGAPIVVYGELEMVSGMRLFLEIHTEVEERLPIEQVVFFQQIFALHGMHARRRAGGMLIINPAMITRLTIYPGPTSPLPGAWITERQRG